MMGRAAFENVCAVENFGTDKVAILIGDDRGGAPLVLYVGEKGSKPSTGYAPPSFLVSNGLGNGRLFVWTTPGDSNPSTFNGTGASRNGRFVPITHYEPAKAGLAGFDALGFVTQSEQDSRAAAAGAFAFSRPEDLARNPEDGTQIAFASTGRSSLFGGADSWGTTYVVDLDDDDLEDALDGDLSSITGIAAEISILYDGDDAGDGQFSGPDYGLRSPDNVDWAADGFIYVNEDRSVGGFGQTSGVEASVWRIDPSTGKLTRILEIDRSAVPAGQSDPSPTDIGNWESSGVLDVTHLFKAKKGETLLLLDVQAHSVRDGLIGGSSNYVQGGQLVLVSGPSSDDD
jgi:secreted PhoX family phosphatase